MLRGRQRGFSLVEWAVASTIGLLVLSGVIGLHARQSAIAADGLARTRLHRTLHDALALMLDDLRRAGFRAADPTLHDLRDNPFMQAPNRLRVEPTDPGCVLFAYDANRDGRVGVGGKRPLAAGESGANMEQFGYRLRSGRLEMRAGGQPFDCRHGRWQAVTGPDILVTDLHFTVHRRCVSTTLGGCAGALYRQRVAVFLRGALRASPGRSLTLEGAVTLRNDFHAPAPVR